MTGGPRWLDLAISRVLRFGVLLSISIIVTGMAITFVHHASYLASHQYPHTMSGVITGIGEGHGAAIMSLGILVLIATPVARVALSVIIFAIERDRLYALITTAVLLLLMVSFALGGLERL